MVNSLTLALTSAVFPAVNTVNVLANGVSNHWLLSVISKWRVKLRHMPDVPQLLFELLDPLSSHLSYWMLKGQIKKLAAAIRASGQPYTASECAQYELEPHGHLTPTGMVAQMVGVVWAFELRLGARIKSAASHAALLFKGKDARAKKKLEWELEDSKRETAGWNKARKILYHSFHMFGVDLDCSQGENDGKKTKRKKRRRRRKREVMFLAAIIAVGLITVAVGTGLLLGYLDRKKSQLQPRGGVRPATGSKAPPPPYTPAAGAAAHAVLGKNEKAFPVPAHVHDTPLHPS